MALIKCPECDNKISDKAEVCPKCGYELNVVKAKKNVSDNDNRVASKLKKDGAYRYLFIFAVLLILFLLFTNRTGSNNNNDNGGTGGGSSTPAQTEGYMVYTDKNLGLSFEYPNGYKVVTDKDGFVYVARTVSNGQAAIPYVIVGKYKDFNNGVQFLNSFTDYLRKSYSDLVITIDLVSGNIGDKFVYGIAYNYTSSGHLVVDNRYAIVLNNAVYMVGTKEENTNSTEVNSLAEHVIKTLVVGGN